jgi:hypothetical protein
LVKYSFDVKENLSSLSDFSSGNWSRREAINKVVNKIDFALKENFDLMNTKADQTNMT